MKAQATWPLAALVVVLFLAGCSKDSSAPPRVAAGTNKAPLLIVPHTSVGDIRFGMTATQVVALLGEPQRRTANALEYTHLGFAVLPNAQGVVQVVMCGDVMGVNRPLALAFNGRTKEGIGMNSTREEVVKAFGDPSQSQKFPGEIERLTYDGLGMTLTLEGGRVYHLIVRLEEEEKDRTVGLEGPKKD
jgi:hypothetical protein